MTSAAKSATLPGQDEAVRLLARRWPAEGRHFAYRGLVGGLLRSKGWNVERAEAFVAALAEATDDEEPDKRLALVACTAAKLKENKPCDGWPKLATYLGDGGEKIVGRFKALLGLTITLEMLAAHSACPLSSCKNKG